MRLTQPQISDPMITEFGNRCIEQLALLSQSSTSVTAHNPEGLSDRGTFAKGGIPTRLNRVCDQKYQLTPLRPRKIRRQPHCSTDSSHRLRQTPRTSQMTQRSLMMVREQAQSSRTKRRDRRARRNVLQPPLGPTSSRASTGSCAGRVLSRGERSLRSHQSSFTKQDGPPEGQPGHIARLLSAQCNNATEPH